MSLRDAISVVITRGEYMPEVASVRHGWPARAACAAGFLLPVYVIFTGPAQAVPQAVPQAAALQAVPPPPLQAVAPEGPGLPGPLPGCPPQRGIAAPASPPWAQQVLGFSAVWDLTRGAGVTVAVVDSGVDANPQFGHRVVLGPDLARDGQSVAADADCVGHGTSMASIIAAAPVPGISFTGVAPAARILSIKISNSDTFSNEVTSEAIRDAVELGASVINLSLATTDDSAALRSAVDFALRSDVVVVAAAGNDDPGAGANGGEGSGPFYPAAYPGVLSVGAVKPDGSLAGFSDTRTPVSVTAPGADVASAYPGVFPRSYNSADNGTSFAAAFVSGVVALVRSSHPRLDEAQVVARIEATADGAAGPGTGHGLVNPVQAVTAVLPSAELAGAGPGQGGGGASGPGAGGHPGRVTITRAEPPGRSARTVAMAVIAGSFGIMVVVLTAVTVMQGVRRRARPAARPARSAPGPVNRFPWRSPP